MVSFVVNQFFQSVMVSIVNASLIFLPLPTAAPVSLEPCPTSLASHGTPKRAHIKQTIGEVS